MSPLVCLDRRRDANRARCVGLGSILSGFHAFEDFGLRKGVLGRHRTDRGGFARLHGRDRRAKPP